MTQPINKNSCEKCGGDHSTHQCPYGDRQYCQDMSRTDLMLAWDLASIHLKDVATAARNLGDTAFATEAEVIAAAFQARVTALSNLARKANEQQP